MSVQQDELIELRSRVDCRIVLERAGWVLDQEGSTSRAARYRQGAGRIIVITHEGRGWFDPLSDARGDVLALAQHVWGGTLGHARKNLRPLAGLLPRISLAQTATVPPIDAEELWARANHMRSGSPGWQYLTGTRGLPVTNIEQALRADALREGIYATVWFRHCDQDGRTTGWEMRGPNYKGFSKGGRKTLFRFGNPKTVDRIAVTESAIDAISLADLEARRVDTVYLSTGGGFGPGTINALQALLVKTVTLIAATDQGTGGDKLADQLSALAATHNDVAFVRLIPSAKDWNDQLRARGDRSANLHGANPACC